MKRTEQFFLPLSLSEAKAVCIKALYENQWQIREELDSEIRGWKPSQGLASEAFKFSITLMTAEQGTHVTLVGDTGVGQLFDLLGVVGRPLKKMRAEIQALATQPAPHIMDKQRSRDISQATEQHTPREASAVGNTNAIFISYRRDDSADTTGSIHDHLSERFTKEAVFRDVDSIDLGENYKSRVANVIDICSVLLAVIGDKWLNITDKTGSRRLDDPEDLVRFEIELALKRADILVIPVLVQGAEMPAKSDLPPPLAELHYHNAMHIRRDPDFRHDMERLIKYLEQKVHRI